MRSGPLPGSAKQVSTIGCGDARDSQCAELETQKDKIRSNETPLSSALVC